MLSRIKFNLKQNLILGCLLLVACDQIEAPFQDQDDRILPTQSVVLYSPTQHGIDGGFNRIEVTEAQGQKYRQDYLFDSDREWFLAVEDVFVTRTAGSQCTEADLAEVALVWDWLLLDKSKNNQVLRIERVGSFSGQGQDLGRQYRVMPGSRYSLRVRVHNPGVCRSFLVEFRVRPQSSIFESKHCRLYEAGFPAMSSGPSSDEKRRPVP